MSLPQPGPTAPVGRPGTKLVPALWCLLVLLLWCAAMVLAERRVLGDPNDSRFSVLRWERRQLPTKLVYALGRPWRPQPPDSATAINRYMAAARRVRELRAVSAGNEDEAAARALVDAESATAERKADAESAIEREVGRAARDLGLKRRMTPVLGPYTLWPPVLVALDETPFVVARSPRSAIRLHDSWLLRPGLSDADIAREKDKARAGGWSVIVEELGGFAAYPAVVRAGGGGARAVEIAAHEWVHHYLSFYPLGAAYGDSPAMAAINEAVADIAGREIAVRALAGLGLEPEPPAATPTVDVRRILRETRVRAESLLSAGDIAGAELLMQQAQCDLAAGSFPIADLNQAYFAFHGQYVDAPGGGSPITARLVRLRRTMPTVSDFLQAVRGLRLPAELETVAGTSARP